MPREWKKYQAKHRIARRRRGVDRKQKLIELSGGCCVHCGYGDQLPALCFHHLRDKKFSLDQRNLYQKTWDVIVEEWEKCELLCHNCHAIHHEIEREQNANRNPASEKRHQRRLSRKQHLIDMFGGSCQTCGFTSNYTQCMSFDHIDPATKSFELNVTKLGSCSLDAAIEESKKCRLLCMNCHIAMNPDR